MAMKGRSRADLLITKVQLVCSQKEELYGAVDEYVDKVTSSVKSRIENEAPDMKACSEMNSELEKVLVFLLQLGTHVEGVPNDQQVSQTNEESPSAGTEIRASHREEAGKPQLDTTRIQRLEEQLKQMETKYDNVMKEGDSRMEKIEKRLKKTEAGGKQDVSRLDNVMAEVETLKTQFRESQQELSKLSCLENKVETLNKDYNSLWNEKIQQLQETNDSLTSRVDTLATKDDLDEVKEEVKLMKRSTDDLSTKFDTNKSAMDEVKGKIQDLTTQIIQISTKVEVLDCKMHKTNTGFTAYLKNHTSIKKDQIIPFDDIRCNKGNNYSPKTGIFTAPKDGLYVTSLCMKQLGEGHIEGNVFLVSPNEANKIKCYADTSLGDSCGTGTAAVTMKVGDQLHVKVVKLNGVARLSDISSFTCFMIG